MSVIVKAFTTWEPVRIPRPGGRIDMATHGTDKTYEIVPAPNGIRVRERGAESWARIWMSNLKDTEEVDAPEAAGKAAK